MICEIITIGTEVVMGSTANSNSLFLSRKLTELGLEVVFHTSVDDDKDRLKAVIDTAMNRSTIIITTGGLGPTKDDMTKEIISSTLGLELKFDDKMGKNIENMFKNFDSNMTENNYKQAYIPEGAKFIENKLGTAPGIYIEKNKQKLIMLPGPPFEMESMFNNGVKKLLSEDLNIVTRSINLVGIGESTLETQLNELDLNTKDTSILTFAKEGIVEIKIIAKGQNKKTIQDRVEIIIKKIEEKFSPYIYGYDNIDLESIIVDLLNQENLTLGLCESITGGMIASRLTRVPGASKILDRSIVSYSNNAKMEELNVKKETLKEYGAVSKETAYEMANGLLLKSDVDIALSITGLAGPGGASQNKAIGLVYMSIVTKDYDKTHRYIFNGDRDLIRERATIKALDKLRQLLVNID